MPAAITPLTGHAVFLLLLQIAALLIVARLGAEVMRRLGLPAVLGELSAGIILGPTIFGRCLPAAFAAVFPSQAAQFQLLEVVGTLGLVFLLLLTGLETDLRLLRNLGRAALVASTAGMLVPFALGYALGFVMPDVYLAQPDHRVLFAAFLATAMAISAMPVIAKILMDLDLTRRNIGLVILSAGVVDDTAGWLVLSVIAGAARHGGTAALGDVGLTILLLAAFVVGMIFIGFPFLKLAFRAVSRFRSPDADLLLIVVFTLLCAAATERIGVHAAFGAFVAGVTLRQLPHLEEGAVQKLEAFVLAVLAPVFFGIVGLKADLFSIGVAGGVAMLGIVFGVACFGKLFGCTAGGVWSGMRFWEAFSIAIALNARGAMGLIVATIGLSLGILNQQMFSIIVVVAFATSFMAPLGLRLSMRYVRMTEDEAKRISAELARGAFDPARIRVLVPTAAGPNSIEAALLAFSIAGKSRNPVEVLNVEAVSGWRDRLRAVFRRRSGPQRGIAEHFDSVLALAQAMPGLTAPKLRKVVGRTVSGAILGEAAKGTDAILIGASQHTASLGGRILEEVVVEAPCHVVIVRAGAASEPPSPRRRVLVPVDGSIFSRVAAEFALRYCEAADAELAIAVQVERRRFADNPTDGRTPIHPPPGALAGFPPAEFSPEEELDRISPLFRHGTVKPRLLHLNYDPTHSAVLDEVRSGRYDMVVIGAENRAIRHRMFFGYNNERLIRHSVVSLVVVVPNLGRLR
jgi:Kef-type K+ transport system membrane component KefB/nucleotide-binding universal stress UspA family protein